MEERQQKIRDMVAEQYDANDVMVDADAKVKEGDDNGAFVQAWVWVRFADTDLDKNDDEDEEGCSICDAALDDGEGYDGLCGSCADRAEG